MVAAGVDERLDHFMARANATYYASRDPFADFTTAPEICQAFGEVLGLWAAVTWEQLGRPSPVILGEAGPGRGTLMRDALRAISAGAPAFHAALSVHLIETSPRLRATQAATLTPPPTPSRKGRGDSPEQSPLPLREGVRGRGEPVWHDAVATLPDQPLILLANEFLDALPIRQFVRRSGAWVERFVRDRAIVENAAPAPRREAGDGEVVEVCEAAAELAGTLGRRFAARPGAALVLDYGPTESAPGDSLQAIRSGRPADPLSEAGSADLTAHVDFASLVRAARAVGGAAHGPIPQGVFLTRLGLLQRTDRLARTQPPARALALIEAARRLVEPHQMGRLFKALALSSPGCPMPAGFEEPTASFPA
ncbi:MAG TPA: SAM-dependent methyltransferase [Acetobacteraceae bacterium]